MYIILFIIILGILIFVHELGHFLSAKLFGVRVDEFALGFPPRIVSKKIGETDYVLNSIPIGGYVKILGEDGGLENEPGEMGATERPLDLTSSTGKRFAQVSRGKQAVILASGIAGNIIFGWLIISIGFMFGLPTPAEGPFANEVKNQSLIVTSVLTSSPAQKAGLLPGDKILELRSGDKVLELPNGENAGDFIASSPENTLLYLTVARAKGVTTTIEVLPEEGIVSGKQGIGISMEYAGILQLAMHKAFIAGGFATVSMTKSVAGGIYDILTDAFRGEAKLSSFSGPVGIALMIGDAEKAGFVNLLILVAIISVNLAVINLVPLPALDGGRLLFVAIESVIRKPINPKFTRLANQIGFLALLALMVVITFGDIIKIIK